MEQMRRGRWLLRCGVATLVLSTSITHAHDGHEHDHGDAHAEVNEIARTDPKSQVQIKVQGEYRYITSNGIPDHATGQFPNANNPNAIKAQQYKYRMPVNPKQEEKPNQARGYVFGVAMNGVPFDPGTAEFWNGDRRWNYEAISGPLNLGLDQSNAHVQPTGAYHYHGVPVGMIRQEKDWRTKMTLVGYAADGFPIYGPLAYIDANDSNSKLKVMKSSYRVRSGNRPDNDDGPGGKYDGSFTRDYEYVGGSGDLDECNGRAGVTPEYPNGTYYYVLTEDFPYVPRMWRAQPDESFQKQDLQGPGGGGGPRGLGGRMRPGDGQRPPGWHRPPERERPDGERPPGPRGEQPRLQGS